MRAIKKINNNIALCVDSNGTELIAFGKGLGFSAMPYEIRDLKLIDRTFYHIDRSYYELLGEIPEKIFQVSADIVMKAQTDLNCALNPNLVITLADHINFSIIRLNKYKKLKMYFSYDIEQLYPIETALGAYAVKLIRKKLFAALPNSEITNIAMHLVNAREEATPESEGPDVETLIDAAVEIIEERFHVIVQKDTFQFNRFALHLRYYLKRLREKDQFPDISTALLQSMKGECPEIYHCAAAIAELISALFNERSTEEEILYFMVHVNRIVNSTTAV